MSRKQKLRSIHSISISGTSDKPVLKFTGYTKNNKEYSIEANLDSFDIEEIIREIIKYSKWVETSAINRLRGFRIAMKYSNSEPVISYIESNNSGK